MNTEVLDNKVEEFTGVARKIEDIKASYPDEWIVIGNPEMDLGLDFFENTVFTIDLEEQTIEVKNKKKR